MRLFGVNIGNEKKEQILSIVENALSHRNKNCFIATLNNEILLAAEKDAGYRNILNSADLRIIDSTGIKIAALLKGKHVGDRFAGADLASRILDHAGKNGLRVGIVLRTNGLSSPQEVRKALAGTNHAIFQYDLTADEERFFASNASTLQNVEVLIVGVGAPQQEKLIQNIRSRMPKLRLAIGVGGTIDFWTGRKKRAPAGLRKIGLEWIWRLLVQPSRATRIWNATFVFLRKTLKYKN